MNFRTFIRDYVKFADETFGPGDRTLAICDHIEKELNEIKAKPEDLEEWIDIILLASDGARRTGASPKEVCDALRAKFKKNTLRKWPDWRTAPKDKAIEHVRTNA